MKNKKSFSYYYSRFGVFAILLVSIIVATFLSDSFLTQRNLINILRQNAMTTIIACGIQMIIIAGEIDLSPGSVVAFSGCIATMVMRDTASPVLAIATGLVIGLVLGFVNGFLTTHFNIPAFIATLATQQAARGGIYVLTGAIPIMELDESFTWLGQGYIGPIPVPIIVLFVVLVISWIILNKLPFGRHLYAVGGNKAAARASGINVKRVKIKAFMIGGLFSGLSGVILMSRLYSGQPSAAVNYEFDAITACVIGGTSMSGGIGNVYGTIAGALFVAVLVNIMTLLNVNSYYQQMVQGIIIALAVIIDVRIRNTNKA